MTAAPRPPRADKLTITGADLVRRLARYQQSGESVHLTAKRLLGDHLDMLDAPSPRAEHALAIGEALTEALGQLTDVQLQLTRAARLNAGSAQPRRAHRATR